MHPFEKMNRRTGDALRELEIQRYEASRVEFLLNRCNMGRWRSRLYSAAEETLGHRVLRLSVFNDFFPDFPIVLGASRLDGVKLHTDKRSLLPALFRDFESAPFVAAYEEFFEANIDKAQGRAVGLVFPRKGLKQGLIMHNGGLDAYWVKGTSLVYTGGTRKAPVQLYVQAYQSLIDAIYGKGHGWRPEPLEN